MATVNSSDGTTIAFERSGEGPPLILVDGALSYREGGGSSRPLAALLAQRFTVYVEGQTHMVKPKALAPLLAGFLTSGSESYACASSAAGW